MKKYILLISITLISCLFMGCSQTKVSKDESINFALPDGIPALTMAKMIKENEKIENITVNYSIQKTPDTLVANIMSDKPEMAIVPSNLACQIYNKGLGYKIYATSTWGSFYLISDEDIDDLKGKEITTIGKGLTPDIVLRYVLNKNGINPDSDVKINYLNGATELAPSYISGKNKLIAVPEPMLSVILSKKPDTKILMNLNEEWSKVTNSDYGYPQSTLIVRDDFAKDNNKFIMDYVDKAKNYTQWSVENVDKLSEYAINLNLDINKDIIKDCISRANMKFVEIKESKSDYENYFKILGDFEVKSIGGKIPDEGIYAKEQ